MFLTSAILARHGQMVPGESIGDDPALGRDAAQRDVSKVKPPTGS